MRGSNLTRLVIVLAFAISIPVVAQTTGTIAVSGTVGNAVSLQFYDTPITYGTPAASGSNSGAQFTALNYTLALGNVSPTGNTANFVGGKVRLAVRSNNTWNLSAAVATTGLVAAPGAGDLQLSDFGFGVPNSGLSASGVQVNNAALTPTTNNYNNDPTTLFPVAGGAKPPYATTLATLSGTPTIISGPRISNGGSLASTNNALLVTTVYTLQPQFFTALTGNFTVTVTYTVSTP
jgi:hypothetical protein